MATIILGGKRGRNKIQTNYTLKDVWQDYVATTGNPYAVTKSQFMKVCKAFNKAIVTAIIERSETFKMPAHLGYFRIKKTKMKYHIDPKKNIHRVDWPASQKAGKIVYHLNLHREGHRYRFYWNKYNCRVVNKTMYRFNINRTDARRLSNLLKTNKSIDYYE